MLPLIMITVAFYLGQTFCQRSQPLVGVLVFVAVALAGVIVASYIEAAAKLFVKELVRKTLTGRPEQSRPHKPRPEPAGTPT